MNKIQSILKQLSRNTTGGYFFEDFQKRAVFIEFREGNSLFVTVEDGDTIEISPNDLKKSVIQGNAMTFPTLGDFRIFVFELRPAVDFSKLVARGIE